MSKFCRHILWSIRHSLSFNLVSPGGPLSSYFMWKLYRVFIPVHFQLLQSWGSGFFFLFTGGDVQASIVMLWRRSANHCQTVADKPGLDVRALSVTSGQISQRINE